MKIKLCLFLSMVVFIPGVDADYVPEDRFGNRQYHEPSYKTEGDKIIPTDNFGVKQYNSPSYQIEKDGRLNAVDRFGNRQFQDYQIQGDKVIPVDRFGNKDNSRSIYQKK
jgi:hypothetical protein